MIIKKPYGFLIKHYKIINFILLIPIIYLTLKFKDISTFFNQYINNAYSTPETVIAGKYITSLTYIVTIVLIVYDLLIYTLMKQKKKPTLEYALISGYYIVLLIMTLYFYNTMTDIELRNATDAGALMAKDISNIIVIPGYVIAFLTVLRAIGFNIKTFRLDNNLNLQVTEDDVAEVELKIGADGYAVKRGIVHVLREIKYYIFENKFVFTCLGAVVLVTILTSIYMNFGVYNKKYNANQPFAMDDFTYTVKSSYITDVNYGGNVVASNYYYLIVEMNVLNRATDPVAVDAKTFRIYVDKDTILFPDYSMGINFIDLAESYIGEAIKPEESRNIVLAYKMDKKDVKKSYKLKVLNNLQIKNGQLIPSYRIVKIKPQNLLTKQDMGTYKLGQDVSLKGTVLGDTKLKINSVYFAKSYTYDYETKYQDKKNIVTARNGQTLMIVSDDIKFDESTAYFKSGNQKLYSDFGTLTYNYSSGGVNKEFVSKIVDVTPKNLKGKRIYEVAQSAADHNSSSNRKLVLTIRNKTVTIILDY